MRKGGEKERREGERPQEEEEEQEEEDSTSDTVGNIFSLTSALSRHPPLNNFMAILSLADLWRCRGERAGGKEGMEGR